MPNIKSVRTEMLEMLESASLTKPETLVEFIQNMDTDTNNAFVHVVNEYWHQGFNAAKNGVKR